MIHTSRQLKDKVRNMSGGNSTKAQTLIRNFIMERFLERITLSEYRDNFVLKGGMLVAALIGSDMRATMDIDATVRSLTISMDKAREIIESISAIQLDDGISFSVTRAYNIMEEHDYPGIRFMIEATFDGLRQTIKVDISTGDVITPAAVMYSYKLMFDDRTIPLYTYNIETLLAEKLETIMARGTANTRMRDFYDIYIIMEQKSKGINLADLHNAFYATSQKRGTSELISRIDEIISDISNSASMEKDWNNYKDNNYFVGNLFWNEVVDSVIELIEITLQKTALL